MSLATRKRTSVGVENGAGSAASALCSPRFEREWLVGAPASARTDWAVLLVGGKP